MIKEKRVNKDFVQMNLRVPFKDKIYFETEMVKRQMYSYELFKEILEVYEKSRKV